jgi:CRISPR system Cascade subunit CasD
MAFGCEAIDANGPSRDFPDASMLTGLLANALGLVRPQLDEHQRLQDRLTFGVRIDRLGEDLRDFQTAAIAKADQGWTTFGRPEGRAGGENSYASPHLRFRHFRADAALTVALQLAPVDEYPTLQDCAAALVRPPRPLFIGRKPCIPSEPLCDGIVEAHDMVAALNATPLRGPGERHVFILPLHEASNLDRGETIWLSGRRDWAAGLHTGRQSMVRITLEAQPEPSR